jgi:hypothetical protein
MTIESYISAYTASVYTTVLLTLERYVAACWPLRARIYLRKKRVLIITLSALIVSVLLNLPRWFEGIGSQPQPIFHVDIIEHASGKRAVFWKNAYSWNLDRKYVSSNILRHAAYRKYYHGLAWVSLMYGVPIPSLIFLNWKIWKEVSLPCSYGNRYLHYLIKKYTFG